MMVWARLALMPSTATKSTPVTRKSFWRVAAAG